MELPLSTTAKFVQLFGFWTQKTIHRLKFIIKWQVYGESCMDIKNIRKWCREFAFGLTEICDEKRSGRPSTCNETVTKVEETMHKNRWVSLDDLCVSIPEVTRTIIYRILTDKLQYWNVCARLFPWMLIEDHKQQRVDSAHEFLRRYADKKDKILDSIVTGSET